MFATREQWERYYSQTDQFKQIKENVESAANLQYTSSIGSAYSRFKEMGKSFNTPGTATGLKAFLQRQAETSYDETASGIKQDISTKAGDTLMSSIQAGGKTQMDILERLNKVGEDRFKAEKGVGLDLETGTRDTGWMVDTNGALTAAGKAYYATLLYDFRDFGDASDADIELFKKAVVGDVDIANKEYNEAFYRANEQFVSDPDKASPEFKVGDDEETRYSAVTGKKLTPTEIIKADLGVDLVEDGLREDGSTNIKIDTITLSSGKKLAKTTSDIEINNQTFIRDHKGLYSSSDELNRNLLEKYETANVGDVVFYDNAFFVKQSDEMWNKLKLKK